MKTIYADYAASAPLEPAAWEAMAQWAQASLGNPSSGHFRGTQARELLENARRKIAETIGCRDSEVIFTSGGTEADNLAILGMMSGSKTHMITSAIEHPAVLRTCAALEKRGVRVSYAPVDHRGVVDVSFIASEVTEDTGLIAVMAVNNETGVIQPIEQISRIARHHGIPFFTDAVQGAFCLPLWEHVDLMSISAHKLGGPGGIGVLAVRSGTRLEPILFGGGQERGYRSGTENAMAIAGMAAAVELAAAKRACVQQALAVRERLVESLSGIPLCHFNGSAEDALANIVSVCFDYVNGQDLVELLSRQGICVSSSSACATGAMEPSHVLRAMGVSAERARGALRISFGRDMTVEDACYLAQQIALAVKQLRNLDFAYVRKYGRT